MVREARDAERLPELLFTTLSVLVDVVPDLLDHDVVVECLDTLTVNAAAREGEPS